MADVMYNRAKARSASADTDLNGANIRAMILETTAAGAIDPDLNTVADLLAVGGVTEATGTGAARLTVTSTVTEDDTNNRANVGFSALTWSGANWGNALAIVFYDEGGGTDATRFLISYHDFPSVIPTNGGSLTVNAGDYLRLS